MRKYYAEQVIFGRDKPIVIEFKTKQERDNYVLNHDYSNTVKASELIEDIAISYETYKSYNSWLNTI